MQIMVIEYARDILGWKDAHSTEFCKSSKHPVISLLEEQREVKNMGGTMRLGASESVTMADTGMRKAYGTEKIMERHRHRYEVSNLFRGEIEAAGLLVTATTPDGDLVESCEWPDHPWGLGVQFHPELKSKPTKVHPLFKAFVGECATVAKARAER
jgi:CTP synthase